MTAKLPYMLSTGVIPKILEKIQNARRPERFTQDFLETKLGHSGGSSRAIIPLLKRMGLLGSDGVPTKLYDQFRNTDTQGYAIAEGLKNAYVELFDRNEYVYEMSREKLTQLVVEITGASKSDRAAKAIVGTFSALNEIADFEGASDTTEEETEATPQIIADANTSQNTKSETVNLSDNVELRMGYTINLNLPETTDPDVFNAIFKALKEHLLRN